MKKEDNIPGMLILKALAFFLENPEERIHLRGFCRKLELSPNTGQRFLEVLVKEGMVLEERKANLREFYSNKESIVFKMIKKAYSVRKIANSGLIDHLKKHDFSFVVLFGSIARGEDDKNSDVDLVCIGGKKQDLSEFEEKLHREVNTHFFSWAEWQKQAKQNRGFYLDVISQGINLLGPVPIAD